MHTAPALQADRRSRFVLSAPRLVSIAFRTRHFRRKRLPSRSRFRQRWFPKARASVFVRAAVPSLGISSRARLPLKAMVFASGEIQAHFVKNRAFRRLALAHAMMASLIFSERRAPGRRFARPPPSGPPIGTQPRALHGKAGREARFRRTLFSTSLDLDQ